VKVSGSELKLEPSHNASAWKKVLLRKGDCASGIVFMNEAFVEPGKRVESHSHPDLEEFDYFFEGKGKMTGWQGVFEGWGKGIWLSFRRRTCTRWKILIPRGKSSTWFLLSKFDLLFVR
jgi:hypothetical protein